MNEDPSAFQSSSFARTAGMFAFFLAIALAIYFPSLKGPFVFDDIPFILENPNLKMDSFSAQGIIAAATSRRPLTTVSYALNHFFHGYDTLGFHVVNVKIHALAALFLFLLAQTTLFLAEPEKNRQPVAFFAALVFLCHPLATQSVSYISQRANAMCALFYIMSLLFYAKGRLCSKNVLRRVHFALCGISGVMALLSKENAATLPFFIFLYEWIFFRKADEKWLKLSALPVVWLILLMLAALSAVVGRGEVHPVLFAAGLMLAPVALYMAQKRLGRKQDGKFFTTSEILLTCLLAAVAAAIWAKASPWAMIMHEYKNIAPITPMQRLLTEARIVFIYLGLFFLPLPSFLSLSHDVPVSTGLFSNFGTPLAIGAMAFIFIYSVRNRKAQPILFFAVFMYFGNLVLESSIYPLHLIFEHRAYLPVMILCLALISWVFGLFPRQAATVMTVLVILLGVLSFERNRVWADDLLLWQDAAKKAPNDPTALNNLGIALFNRGRVKEARIRFALAMTKNPQFVDAPYNMGLANRSEGRLRDAEAMFRRVLSIRDDSVFAHNDLGLTLMDLGQEHKAELHFKKALAWDPNFARASNNLGTLMMNRGDISDAIARFREAIESAPGFIQARINLGVALLQQGKAKEAVMELERAAAADPQNAEAFSQLGNALLHSGDTALAITRLRRAIELDPNNADSRNSLAVALTAQGRNLEAIVEYRAALALMEKETEIIAAKADPKEYSVPVLATERAAIHKNLALALSRMKQHEKAQAQLEKAVALTPSDFQARLGLGSVFAARGLDEKAYEVFSKAADDFPDNPEVLRDLGRILMKLKRPREALTAFSQAALLAPADTGIHQDIARARDLIDKMQTETN